MAENVGTSAGAKALRTILLVGATGEYAFGQFVIREIIQSASHFTRIGVYVDGNRDNSAKTSLLSRLEQAGIELVHGKGYEDPAPFRGFDCVLSFLGNHGLRLQPQLINTAIAAGVRHIYPSEYGADIDVGDNRSQRYYVEKVRTRDHLEQRGRELPDLGWSYVLFGRLTEWSVTPHFGFDNQAAHARIYGSPNGRQSLISAADAAAYLVMTLVTPHDPVEEGRRTFRFAESSPTYASLFETLKLITGRQYHVEYLDVETAQVEEAAAKARGDVDAELAASHKLIQGRQGTLLPEPWDNGRFSSITPTSLQDTLTAAFQSPKFRKAYGLKDS